MSTDEKCPKCGASATVPENMFNRHVVDGGDCLRCQLAALQAIVDRLDWWMEHLAYKAPEQMFGQVRAMISELHPKARAAAEEATNA